MDPLSSLRKLKKGKGQPTERCPAFEHALGMECTLAPGDMLVAPGYTWIQDEDTPDSKGLNSQLSWYFKDLGPNPEVLEFIPSTLREANTPGGYVGDSHQELL